jgi:hypothetical protein
MRKINGYTLAEMRAEAKARIAAREAESAKMETIEDIAAEIARDIKDNNFQEMGDFEDFLKRCREASDLDPPKNQ